MRVVLRPAVNLEVGDRRSVALPEPTGIVHELGQLHCGEPAISRLAQQPRELRMQRPRGVRRAWRSLSLKIGADRGTLVDSFLGSQP
jgi:hypothetical protein